MINLYKGDNEEILKKINLSANIVFIDPPYNTKNSSLTYKDNKGDSTSWKIYFKNKLSLIKQNLAKNTAIFVTIGTNELGNAILSIEETFGKKSILVIMPRITNNVAKTTKTISKINDFLIVAKKGNVSFNGIGIMTDTYKKEDKYFKARGKYQLRRLDYSTFKYSHKQDFKIVFKNKEFVPGIDFKKWEKRQKNPPSNSKDWSWLWSKKKIDFALKNNFIEIKNNCLYKKTYTNAEIIKEGKDYYRVIEKERTMPFSSLELIDQRYVNSKTNNEYEQEFSYPKSEELINWILSLPKFKEKIVLDPYAGSGITGIVAEKLNIEAHLIQLPESINGRSAKFPKNIKTVYDLTINNLKKRGVKVNEK